MLPEGTKEKFIKVCHFIIVINGDFMYNGIVLTPPDGPTRDSFANLLIGVRNALNSVKEYRFTYDVVDNQNAIVRNSEGTIIGLIRSKNHSAILDCYEGLDESGVRSRLQDEGISHFNDVMISGSFKTPKIREY